MALKDEFTEEYCKKLRSNHNGTWKAPVLEYIFRSKFTPDDTSSKIPFSHGDLKKVSSDILGWDLLETEPKGNYNNFVKDLVRHGDYSPRCDAAEERGYILRESSDSEYIGVFEHEDSLTIAPSVECPNELEPVTVDADFPNSIRDLLRPDEGGLLSALDYCDLLRNFFGSEAISVKRVQAPVKKQPEIDGLYVLEKEETRYLIPCEAKSQSGDVINLHQIEGSTETAFNVASDAGSEAGSDRGLFSEKPVSGAYPIGAKILSNGDIHLAKFGLIEREDLDDLSNVLATKGVVEHARYSLAPKPPQW